MGKLNKFENVDVTASLEAIMKQNTAFYQSDFDIDKEIIKRAAESPNAGDKMLLWFSRPSGTCCIKERDAFLKGTREHNTWKFYGEQTRDRVLAYAVELTGVQDGKITGNLYELDYQQHYKHVTEQAWYIRADRQGREPGQADKKAPPLCPGAACTGEKENRPEENGGESKRSRIGGMSMNKGFIPLPPQNGVLLRNNPISAPIRKPGRGGY